MEYFLSAQHWFDAYDEPVEAYLPRLCRLIAKLCGDAGGQRAASAVPAADAAVPFTGNPYASQTMQDAPRSTSAHVAAASPATGTAAAASAPAPAPATASASAPHGFAETDLTLLESQLAAHIGPIARLLVRKAAARSPDRQSLLDALAGELDQPVERSAFINACRQRLGS